MKRLFPPFLLAVLIAGAAPAQDKGTLHPQPLPALVNPHDPMLPARELFARKPEATDATPQSIGFYSHGCLAGGEALPPDGPHWQVMRPSRNRNWGHPRLIKFLERLSEKGAKVGWRGLLVGDMSQPRGGPMFTGHASHQIGLDADIWLRPMPDHTLTREEREEMSAIDVVADDRKGVDPAVWTPAHAALIKAAAEDPEVERIFVNAAIKKELCSESPGQAWQSKVRPYWGHDYHFHVRLYCPPGSHTCDPQVPPPAGDGCGKVLDWWFKDAVLHPKPSTAPKHQMTMAALPKACRAVVDAP